MGSSPTHSDLSAMELLDSILEDDHIFHENNIQNPFKSENALLPQQHAQASTPQNSLYTSPHHMIPNVVPYHDAPHFNPVPIAPREEPASKAAELSIGSLARAYQPPETNITNLQDISHPNPQVAELGHHRLPLPPTGIATIAPRPTSQGAEASPHASPVKKQARKALKLPDTLGKLLPYKSRDQLVLLGPKSDEYNKTFRQYIQTQRNLHCEEIYDRLQQKNDLSFVEIKGSKSITNHILPNSEDERKAKIKAPKRDDVVALIFQFKLRQCDRNRVFVAGQYIWKKGFEEGRQTSTKWIMDWIQKKGVESGNVRLEEWTELYKDMKAARWLFVAKDGMRELTDSEAILAIKIKAWSKERLLVCGERLTVENEAFRKLREELQAQVEVPCPCLRDVPCSCRNESMLKCAEKYSQLQREGWLIVSNDEIQILDSQSGDHTLAAKAIRNTCWPEERTFVTGNHDKTKQKAFRKFVDNYHESIGNDHKSCNYEQLLEKLHRERWLFLGDNFLKDISDCEDKGNGQKGKPLIFKKFSQRLSDVLKETSRKEKSKKENQPRTGDKAQEEGRVAGELKAGSTHSSFATGSELQDTKGGDFEADKNGKNTVRTDLSRNNSISGIEKKRRKTHEETICPFREEHEAGFVLKRENESDKKFVWHICQEGQTEKSRSPNDPCSWNKLFHGRMIQNEKVDLVEIKWMPSGIADTEVLAKEVALVKKLGNPSLGGLLDSFWANAGLFTITPALSKIGRSIRNGEVIHERDAWRIFESIMDSVDFLHERGYAHLNIQRNSVLVSYGNDDNDVILTGLSMAVKLAENGMLPKNAQNGKREYLIPEVGVYSAWQRDAWAAVLVLYSLVEGRAPANDVENLQFLESSANLQRFFMDILRRDPEQRLVTNGESTFSVVGLRARMRAYKDEQG